MFDLSTLSVEQLKELGKKAAELAERKRLEPISNAIAAVGLGELEFGLKMVELLTPEQAKTLSLALLASNYNLDDARNLLSLSEEDFALYRKPGYTPSGTAKVRKPRKARDTSNLVRKYDLTAEEVAVIKNAASFADVKNLPAGTPNAGKQIVIGIYNSIKGIKVQRKRNA
ncbi:MAG: hypothetical protein SFY80_06865 [Verrucomicrobiota bacterium]|nr:hypothetical protein [Verrucomicrobiota bacterium]